MEKKHKNSLPENKILKDLFLKWNLPQATFARAIGMPPSTFTNNLRETNGLYCLTGEEIAKLGSELDKLRNDIESVLEHLDEDDSVLLGSKSKN